MNRADLTAKLIAQGLIKPEDLKPRTLELDLPEPKRRKWGNVPTEDAGGRLCDSKLEASVSNRLHLSAHAVIQQVSIPLSARPRDRIVLDFLVIEEAMENGRFIGHFADAKGKETKDWIQKARRFEDAYKIPIVVIKK